MPLFHVTLEDTSPMLRYSANWQAADSGSDTGLDQNSLSSATITQQPGETMKLTYYGTSVTVFGSKRSNHGTYQGQLDSSPGTTQSGFSASDQFQTALFSGSTTQLMMHNVTMTNTDEQFLGIDFVTFETSVGKDNEQLIVNTIQDNHPAFNYTPASSWSTPQQVGGFSGNSGHSTTDESATARLTFEGDAITLYGPVGPTGTSKYSVQIDNGDPTVYSAHNAFYRPQEILFFAANLGPGTHLLQIQPAQPIDNGVLAIDYANVYTAASLGGSFLDANFASLSAPAPRATVTTTVIKTVQQSTTPPGMIAALALLTSIAVFGFIAFSYLYWRQRRELTGERMRNDKNLDLLESPRSSMTQTSQGSGSFYPAPMSTEISHVRDNPIVWPVPNQVSTTPIPPALALAEIPVPFVSSAAQYATGILPPPGKLRMEYDSASQQQISMQDGQGSSSMPHTPSTQRQRGASRAQSARPYSATTVSPPRYSSMT